jgi:nucleotide-binding universal stress UspA family protein
MPSAAADGAPPRRLRRINAPPVAGGWNGAPRQPSSRAMYKHILIATDGSDTAARGVEAGLRLAGALRATATLVTASEPWQDVVTGDPSALALSMELHEQQRRDRAASAEALLASVQARANAAGVPLATVYVPERRPAEAILETADACGADLIVMASHGRSGLRKLLLGSQTQAVLSGGTLPVLVVR